MMIKPGDMVQVVVPNPQWHGKIGIVKSSKIITTKESATKADETQYEMIMFEVPAQWRYSNKRAYFTTKELKRLS
jgi:hypothetical protein